MSVCYGCGQILNRKNTSFEHIIPNSIGGILKSARLICKDCNIAYGMTVDAALASDLNDLTAFIHVERDRPKSSATKNNIAPSDERSELEKEPASAKPGIKIKDEKLYITSTDKKPVMLIASRLKRKFAGIDIESIEKKFPNEDILLDEALTIEVFVGSDLYMRSVAKMAVSYYLMKVRGLQHLDKIIGFINGIEANDSLVYYWPICDVAWNEGEMSHVINVKGDASLKQLYAHVILFNTYSMVVNLCDDYDGDEVDMFYRYDVLCKEEIKSRVTLEYERAAYLMKKKDNPGKWNDELTASIQHNLGRLLHTAALMQWKPGLDEMIDKILDKAMSRHVTGKVITQDILNEMARKLFSELSEFKSRDNS